jgi:hypothetical protein
LCGTAKLPLDCPHWVMKTISAWRLAARESPQRFESDH